MATGEATVVVCTYPARNYVAGFAEVLREHNIAAAVVPSDRHISEWDVLVPARDATRANKVVHDLLALD